MRIGIFFGGPSREREIAFAGGRTVYDNLDQRLFTPVPLFVDSYRRLIQLDWPYLYKGSIRDFFPPAAVYPTAHHGLQFYIEHLAHLREADYQQAIAAVGRPVSLSALPAIIDFAFLALHGPIGEDGVLQGMLEWAGIPYSGTGLAGAVAGADKILQKQWLAGAGFAMPQHTTLAVDQLASWTAGVQAITASVGFPCVIKHPLQGSSIGVQIVREANQAEAALQAASFRQTVDPAAWAQRSEAARWQWLQQFIDLREALGLPAYVQEGAAPAEWVVAPARLKERLDAAAAPVTITAPDAPQELLVEAFVAGTEFSVIVIEQPDGTPFALPPTEIIKQQALYDYRSKYLPGGANKRTPIHLPDEQVRTIRRQAEALKRHLGIEVYARLDGILATDGTLYFNDPNTTSGMLPGSFFFHQAAEIGLAPRDFLTYLIQRSLFWRRFRPALSWGARRAFTQLGERIQAEQADAEQLPPVAVIMGGYSSERHISVESGRNIFEKLNSSQDYQPFPVFLLGNDSLQALGLLDKLPPAEQAAGFSLWRLPVRMMLKDNADDIRYQILAHIQGQPPASSLQAIREAAAPLRAKYRSETELEPALLPMTQWAASMAFAFIALHGRPGEDGTLQQYLEARQIPYNGSAPLALALTIDKHATAEQLQAAGFHVAQHRLLTREAWQAAPEAAVHAAIEQLGTPLVAKPPDDGCSTGVRKLSTAEALRAYCRAAFRSAEALPADAGQAGLGSPAELAPQSRLLLETFLQAGPDERQLEVTVGFLTERNDQGELTYRVFEPSEAVAGEAILSLEEKFLAGAGQNITPARFSADPAEQRQIAEQVKAEVREAVQLLGAEGYGRMDAFVRLNAANEPSVYFIELNALPGMTPATAIFHQAALEGYKPAAFVQAIIQEGFRKAGWPADGAPRYSAAKNAES